MNTGSLKYLKGITIFFLGLYILFILMNLLESFWHGLDVLNPLKISLHSFVKQERRIHGWLDIVDFGGRIVFLLLCNHYVRKNGLGKGYHFLIVLLGFLPVFHYFLYFIIWRNLNRSIVVRSGRDFTRSDRKIIFLWIFVLLHTLIPVVYYILVYYSSSPEFVSELIYWKRFELLGRAVFGLLFSVGYISYFIEFRNVINKQETEFTGIDNQLLDN